MGLHSHSKVKNPNDFLTYWNSFITVHHFWTPIQKQFGRWICWWQWLHSFNSQNFRPLNIFCRYWISK